MAVIWKISGSFGAKSTKGAWKCWSRKLTGTTAAIEVPRIRNIGIMAHIDAGKTTTTERMLFYANVIQSLGEVHKGDTVMDFMEQERARGITINSAAISFQWNNFYLNLIDTPGHVDFTVEVERSLRILDGAVAIIDASAGVEAQTVTVWRQADRYQVPRIVFINKMDKPAADFNMCLRDMKNKLKATPLLVQLPCGAGKEFSGVIDLVNMNHLMWDPNPKFCGKKFSINTLDSSSQLWENARKQRQELVEQVADLDDQAAEVILNQDSLDLDAVALKSALRRITIQQKGIPVLLGSAYRNVAIQPLLNAITDCLPDPTERQHEFLSHYKANSSLCALAFKTSHDSHKGVLTYLRLFTGTIQQGQKVYNVSREKTEKILKLFQANADDLTEISEASEGQIFVATGLKDTLTGDTLASSVSAVHNITKQIAHKKSLCESEVRVPQATMQIPKPVFFCSVEPTSMAHQKTLDKALEVLQREDPSLDVKVDAETGQTVLGGMGELHIEIIKDRLLKEFNVEAVLGPLQVAYRETALSEIKEEFTLDKTLGGTRHTAKLILAITIEEQTDYTVDANKEKVLLLARNKETREQIASVWPPYLKAVEQGVKSALAFGPRLSFPVCGVNVVLHSLEVGRRTSETMVAGAASQCISQALRKAGTRLLEPIMRLEVITEESYLSSVLADLNKRRSHLQEVGERQGLKVVVSETPLAELRGYSTSLRTLSSGTGTFSMELLRYRPMTAQEEATAIQEITGFAPY